MSSWKGCWTAGVLRATEGGGGRIRALVGTPIAVAPGNATTERNAAMRLLNLRTVVVATDLDPSSYHALDTAYRLATQGGAALHVVHAVAPDADGASSRLDAVADSVRTVLRAAHVPDRGTGIHVIPGPPVETIGAFADRMGADVIVLGPHARPRGSTHQSPLGGTARGIAERAFAPCLVVPQPLRLPLARVLVPIDRSDTARGALLVGLMWASGLRAGHAGASATSLTALHVDAAGADAAGAEMPAPIAHELDALGADAGDWAGVAVEGRVERGTDAAQAITRFAEAHDADLVVMGTRGLGADEAVRLGSVSAAVALRARVPTLLVPPAVWRAHAAMPPSPAE